MQRVKFSIIVVCLNAGDELHKTVESILAQSCSDYEIIVKDGGSRDGSVESLPALPQIHVAVQEDRGIYDAMNQAVKLATGEYLLFLNCGDYLYDEDVLSKVAEAVGEENAVYYGSLYQRRLGTEVYSYREITPFTCYRNIPCHQTCFYHRSLFEERGYDLKYTVRADYEHFLYCYFTRKAKMICMPLIVSSYEGGGFSETKEHIKVSKAEHKEITGKYLTRGQLIRYRAIMLLTLQPLRTFAANHKGISGVYNRIKSAIYRK
ncbi:MAG: glycosyltransferase family 2 protein [Acetatifactor sp.]